MSNSISHHGRFRIQELNDNTQNTAELTSNNSFNSKNRFKVTTKDIQSNFPCPQLIVFVKKAKVNKWLKADSLKSIQSIKRLLSTKNSNSSLFIDKEENRVVKLKASEQSWSINRAKTQIEIEVETETETKQDCNSTERHSHLKSNDFVFSSIESVTRRDPLKEKFLLQINNDIKETYKLYNERRKIETSDLQFLSVKPRIMYYDQYKMQESFNDSFSILIHNRME